MIIVITVSSAAFGCLGQNIASNYHVMCRHGRNSLLMCPTIPVLSLCVQRSKSVYCILEVYPFFLVCVSGWCSSLCHGCIPCAYSTYLVLIHQQWCNQYKSDWWQHQFW